MTTTLKVYLNQQWVGSVSQQQNVITFQYDKDYLAVANPTPLSYQLPLEAKVFLQEETLPWLAGLLPEARVYTQLCLAAQISERNIFSFLSHYGNECAGAVSFWENEPQFLKPKYQAITLRELISWNNKSATRPMLMANTESRLSLAGAQQKLALLKKEHKLYLGLHGAPSNIIVKPPIDGLLHSVENEFFCMRLANLAGLKVPPVEILGNKNRFYCTTRYDRIFDNKAKIIKLHQEDFCQALGVMPESKYENEGGPNTEKIFRLLEATSTNLILDKTQLCNWFVFNYLIGNADAHGKNISLMISPDGFTLAPFYDLLATEVYPDLSQKLAIKIGTEARGDWITKRHWELFATHADINFKIFSKNMKVFATQVQSAALALSKKTILKPAHKTIEQILKIINKRTRMLERYSKY